MRKTLPTDWANRFGSLSIVESAETIISDFIIKYRGCLIFREGLMFTRENLKGKQEYKSLDEAKAAIDDCLNNLKF